MARFGKRDAGAPRTSRLPEKFKRKLAVKPLASKWFARHVVIDRWFLHAGEPAMPGPRR